LAGCADTKTVWSKSEIEEVAHDSALDALGPVIDRNAGVGNDTIQRLDDLERKVREQGDEIAAQRSRIDRLESEISLIR
jgi:hypothetical protein